MEPNQLKGEIYAILLEVIQELSSARFHHRSFNTALVEDFERFNLVLQSFFMVSRFSVLLSFLCYSHNPLQYPGGHNSYILVNKLQHTFCWATGG